jgi:hypothetical protein
MELRESETVEFKREANGDNIKKSVYPAPE